MARLKVIMIGDVVGEPGLIALDRFLPNLIREKSLDFVVVNGENAADGFGMTEATLQRILAAGADVVTSGNHVWEKREFWPVLDAETRVLRPANYPGGTSGRGWVRVEKAGVSWLVVNLQGREFMHPIDCPFRCFDTMFTSQGEDGVNGGPLILVDFHAESTREKEALGYYLDGRASLVVGTHTHVQTADERVLPQGTAYITDLGMTGVVDSIIGMDTKICLDRARNQVLYRMECAQGDGTLQGIMAEIEGETRRAVSIQRITSAR
ncbi:MAG: TIGR00282 family metallophosphoesterase [Treponema sp.]|jgi:metallophosphoesterase (TIGR00282 family)|nr:TIGR00282 family metallophosphoesterase [Treponema sp.]